MQTFGIVKVVQTGQIKHIQDGSVSVKGFNKVCHTQCAQCQGSLTNKFKMPSVKYFY